MFPRLSESVFRSSAYRHIKTFDPGEGFLWSERYRTFTSIKRRYAFLINHAVALPAMASKSRCEASAKRPAVFGVQAEGFLARSAYKLQEIQASHRIIRAGKFDLSGLVPRSGSNL